MKWGRTGGGRREVDLEMRTTSTMDVEEENPNLKMNSVRDRALNSNFAYSPSATPTVASSRCARATKGVIHQLTARILYGSALGPHTSSVDMTGRMRAS